MLFENQPLEGVVGGQADENSGNNPRLSLTERWIADTTKASQKKLKPPD